jgi:hypothetical protein
MYYMPLKNKWCKKIIHRQKVDFISPKQFWVFRWCKIWHICHNRREITFDTFCQTPCVCGGGNHRQCRAVALWLRIRRHRWRVAISSVAVARRTTVVMGSLPQVEGGLSSIAAARCTGWSVQGALVARLSALTLAVAADCGSLARYHHDQPNGLTWAGGHQSTSGGAVHLPNKIETGLTWPCRAVEEGNGAGRVILVVGCYFMTIGERG